MPNQIAQCSKPSSRWRPRNSCRCSSLRDIRVKWTYLSHLSSWLPRGNCPKDDMNTYLGPFLSSIFWLSSCHTALSVCYLHIHLHLLKLYPPSSVQYLLRFNHNVYLIILDRLLPCRYHSRADDFLLLHRTHHIHLCSTSRFRCLLRQHYSHYSNMRLNRLLLSMLEIQ